MRRVLLAAAVILGTLSVPAPALASACTASGPDGTCGPYDYPPITASGGNTVVGLNGWNCGSPPGCGPLSETVTDPGHFTVSADEPAGNTAVMMFSSVYQPWSTSYKIGAMSEVQSRFTEAMPHTAATDAWAAYDMFIDSSGTSHNEMMVQTENVGGCITCSPVAGHATFGGQAWTLRTFGGEMIWDPSAGATESSGTVRLLAMLKWLEAHGFIGAASTFSGIGFGWEICSTGGSPEQFTVSRYSLTLRPAA